MVDQPHESHTKTGAHVLTHSSFTAQNAAPKQYRVRWLGDQTATVRGHARFVGERNPCGDRIDSVSRPPVERVRRRGRLARSRQNCRHCQRRAGSVGQSCDDCLTASPQ